MIRFAGVSCERDGRPVLRGIDAEFRAAEITVLLGRSGSGKSTLLRLMNRLLEASTGTVTVLGRAVAEWDVYALRRAIGFVPQNLGLFPHRRIGEQMHLAGAERATAGDLLERIGLPATYLDRYPHQLSGGEQQRAALARALAGSPKLLLLDEPFSALDPVTRRQLQQLVKSLAVTTVFVTHDLREAFALGDRIGFLSAGKLAAFGSRQDLEASQQPELRLFLETLA
ncbi:MAG: ATP-binding cassette domain-containing protein [Bryobacteraceae bacterium]|nr:ATP-binding cassette domain-containing protein [Bryobacteraceae bacterium]